MRDRRDEERERELASPQPSGQSEASNSDPPSEEDRVNLVEAEQGSATATASPTTTAEHVVPRRAGAPPLGIRTFATLGYRDFRYLWLGQAAHAASIWLEQVARAILVLDLTNDSPVHLGLILAFRVAPQFLVGLVSGVLADWYSRRTILLIAKSANLTLDFSLALLVLNAQYHLPILPEIALWHVYANVVLKGAFGALDQPARTSLIPSLVPTDMVTSAVALNSSTQSTMRIVGATMAGPLAATIGIGWTLVLVAIIFSGAIYFTARMRVPPQAQVERKSAGTAVSTLVEGYKFAWNTQAIRWVILLATVNYIFGMAYMQLFVPLFARTVLEIGNAGIGYMMATAGAGSLIAALTLATINPQHRRGLLLMGVMLLFGGALVLYSLSTYLSALPLTFLLLALVGAGQTSCFSIQNSVLLTSTPTQMRGRVMALVAQDRSLILVGAALGGFLAAAIGVPMAQTLYGALFVLGVLVISLMGPALRRVD